MKMQNKLPDA